MFPLFSVLVAYHLVPIDLAVNILCIETLGVDDFSLARPCVLLVTL